MEPCVPLDQLERLLDEQLDEREQEAVADHVEGCPSCRRRLEEVADARDAARVRASPGHAPPGLEASFLRRFKERGPRHEPVRQDGDREETPVGDSAQLAGGDEPSAAVAATVASDFLDTDAGPDPTMSVSTPDAADRAPDDGLAPMAIPGFEILGELGRGSMGVVYEARRVRINRPCALKMIRPGDFAGPEAARFAVEAEMIARLKHPHIVQIYSMGDHDGRPYLELEYLDGGSLAQQLDGTPWESRRAARLIETLARAVAEAHRLGVVHRDLKPGNVLLTADGQPKVTDFGLAKSLGADSNLTASGAIMGTPSYMAPEQAEGHTKQVGPAADVYALGAILYELLVGRPPFKGATILQTLEQVRTAEPVPPSRLVPGLSRDAETIVLKCLQKDPAKRYESAAALAEDLRRYRAGEPIVARPVGAAERAWRWCRRNPALAALAAAVVTVALGATLAAFRFRALSQALESNLYFSNIALADRELSADNLGRTLELLGECPEALRRWEWYYLKRLCQVEPVVLRDKAEVNSVAFSPDGELLVSAGRGGTVKVRNSRTGAEVRTLNANTDFVYSVAFHPDGHHLAAAMANREVKVWDLTTGKILFTCAGYGGVYYGTAYGVAFSPDGRRLAAGSDGAVYIWDWRLRQLIHTLPGHDKIAISIAFSPDGRRIATGSWDGGVMIWDAGTGERLHTLSGHRHPVSALAFSPDSRRLVSACYDRLLVVWDANTGQRLRTLRGHDGLIFGVAFSPDGRRIASSGEDKKVRVWEAATGQEVLGLHGHVDMCQCVAFSPDGWRLASCGRDGTIRLWDATPLQGNEGQEALTFSQHAGEVWSLAINPDDGQRIASAGLAPAGRLDTPVKVWDVRSGGVSFEFTGHAAAVFCVAWHPDGQRIASSGVEGNMFVIKVWDARTGRVDFPLRPGAECFAVAFSPDGRHLVTGGATRALQVWDARTGHEVGTLALLNREIRGLSFSRDGRHLASASGNGTVELWDGTRLGEKQEARRILPAWVPVVAMKPAFSPDGRRLVAGGEENTVRIWDVRTGQELRTLRGHSGDVWTSAFSPDPGGRWVASAGEDSTVKVWDSRDGTLLRSFRGHTGLVTCVAFTPDGRRLVSGSRDRTVKVWDLTRLDTRLME